MIHFLGMRKLTKLALIAQERERDLQEELERDELIVFLLDKVVENASLSELVKQHHSKYCSTK